MRVEIVDEDYLKFVERAERILGTDYERKGNYIELDNLLCMIRDLVWEIDGLEEKIDDLEQDMNENYEPRKVDYYIEYGLHPNDFH